jgi:hypothetical protein
MCTGTRESLKLHEMSGPSCPLGPVLFTSSEASSRSVTLVAAVEPVGWTSINEM